MNTDTAPNEMRQRYNRIRPGFVTCLVVSALFAFACASGNQQRQPDTVPAGESIHYATGYPERVSSKQQRISDQKLTAELMLESMPSFPDTLSDPDWGKVRYITEQADQDGRGEAFAERAQEVRIIERFVDEHGENFSRGVARDVDRAVEKEFGESDFRTRRSINNGMGDAVQEHRLQQLEEVSTALQTVTYWTDELGKNNAEALRDQVLSIALTGYIVHTELVLLRNEFEDDLANAEAVKTTLEDELVVVNAFAEAPDQSKSQRQFNEERKQAIEGALARIDQDVKTGRDAMKTLDKEIDALAKQYDDVIKALLADLDKRALDAGTADAEAEGS